LDSNELIEVGVSEHAAHILAAVPHADVAQPTCRNVGVERLDRAAQLRGRFDRRSQAIRRTRLALAVHAWSKGVWGKREQLAGDLACGLFEEVVAKSMPVLAPALAGPAKFNPGGREDRS
jgi:hypothetical protein